MVVVLHPPSLTFFIYLSFCPLIPPMVTRQCWQMGGLVGMEVSNLSSGLLQACKGATGILVLCHLASLLNVTKSPLGIAYLPLTKDGEESLEYMTSLWQRKSDEAQHNL
jgi:hypothetical protein